jgi:copper chaperone CopZ
MNLKNIVAIAALISAAALARAADFQVTLSDVHLCCNSCVRDAKDAVSSVAGASTNADKSTHTISITATDVATAQKAVDALVAAGFYGKSSDSAILVANPAVPDRNVTGLKVGGVHLCCKRCVSDLNKAVDKVKGVTGTNAAKDDLSFEIMGTFNAREVIEALHAAGYSAQIE